MSPKQGATTLRLDIRELTAQLRLGHVTQLGHTGQAAVLGNFQEKTP
jgi:hypothetical protein